MPQIKFRGVKSEKITNISKALVDELHQIIECPKDYLTIEVIQSTFISDGEVVDGYPYVEIGWFDRGQEVQDRVAKSITYLLQKVGYENVDIMFTTFKKESYYENGKHF